MEGAGLAAERQAELALFHAWHGAAFERQKVLKRLSKYLQTGKPQKQGPAEFLAVLQEFKERGAKMNIRRVPH